MGWLQTVLFEHSALQAVVVISCIIAIGLALGKIRIFGISLGVTFVFFAGIMAGHFGLSIDQDMLMYAESFGLVMFVYELGLKVGPGFFSSFRKGGIEMNMLGLGVIMLGTIMAVAIGQLCHVPMSDMVGILSGATTNTPALGAAQQTLEQMGRPTSGAALSCAITYPLGVIGVILALIFIRRFFITPSDIAIGETDDSNHTFIAEFRVHNPAIYHKTVKDIAALVQPKFVISRLWRDGNVTIPTSETELNADDRLLVITNDSDVDKLTVLFGEQEANNWNSDDIDWNAIDSQLISRDIVISRPEINGKKLGSLRLRNTYGINISRIYRSGIVLLATRELILQLGDTLTVVGEAKAIENVEKVLGNTSVDLKDPNLASIFVGIVLGLVIGSIPIAIPGISAPIKLGLAGGPIIAGILMGRFGPKFHLITYTTRSANLMLRGIGLSLFLACLGLDSGAHFMETIMRAEGLQWIMIGFIITLLPVLIMALVSVRWFKLDFGSACGMLCGSMANPMALNYANETLPGDNAAVGYATVYPLSMFCRVVIAQIIVIMFA